ncbi:DNA-binding transcriptional regulator YhcF, GntR family [Lutibacter agarilyticus]|uniref:DNA-binding transcriptional regulator YhcF, GntR family n=1 Tax=Lutibacter agarilyticus TaxID=1109740 RepID=A0A238Z9Y5_9FLAO|nr:GntR family transcriptional regulator [Lutibacter agarilyticus]SNR79879.1 DNA-binding transcriptional regulator YhcF, GntR family [Lutibacter agarilyticus]
MNQITLNIIERSDIPMYQQIVNSIVNSISKKDLLVGDLLPSVNNLSKTHGVSRDTVFKSYTILKTDGIINSARGKGYYVTSNVRRVLLLLDTFKSYKEVLYGSFIDNLAKNVIVDLKFHHNNIDEFKSILNISKGKYYKYIVMNMDHKDVPTFISKIDNDKLLLLDWNIHSKVENNFVFQDFGASFYNCLKESHELFRKYKSIQFIYPSYTHHSIETVNYFKKFGDTFNFKYKVIIDEKKIKIEKNAAYISVSDRVLGKFLEQCREQEFEPGIDVGFLSYNETPMKKFVYKGISVVSTDFKAMGMKAAEFINLNEGEKMQCYIPTKITQRESL